MSLLLPLVVACDIDNNADVDPTPTPNNPVVAHVTEGDGSGLDALIQGPLTLTGECLKVGTIPIVWPHGTTWDAHVQAIRLPDGQAVELGDRVKGSGGYLQTSDLGTDLANRLEDCATSTSQEVAIFNASEKITVTN